MNAIHIRIGNNLQRIRKHRQLSLDKLADLTKVSKGMLHQIERGETQPTVTTVWKIATGLNISFSSLLKEDEAVVSIATRKEIPDLTEDNGNCRVYLLFPFDPQTHIEMFTIILSPACNYVSLPHNDGVQEYITVISGVFNLQIKDEIHALQEGQAIRFAGNVEHRYINKSAEDVTIQVVMYYAES
ncbi:transcriptional regulator with XRE-family HTH domain [Paenibacillus sp. JGP012]|uniref:helix-turn-helix domain-containing protein n=1 Tax=Paenibacillus sp. JGP012 TaxID=2735914 RepID=UPI0017E75C45|nr:XRE family transcriptional regulator [Paenibacillus sp. JGP012]MBB6020475.1 transcriptional regulator with XRE-family HTH domain [Paenibacillus sp. JGP012]